jgi:N-acetylglutamate synthase-like GNAT family acetyltransferase
MPFPYSVYFSSVVIHPQYQNSAVLMKLFNAIIERFLSLGEQEVFIRRMIADAVSKEGEKFCKLFGMSKVDVTDHRSTLYEVSMIPPKFRIASKMTKRLYDFYREKYEEEPYLFD